MASALPSQLVLLPHHPEKCDCGAPFLLKSASTEFPFRHFRQILPPVYKESPSVPLWNTEMECAAACSCYKNDRNDLPAQKLLQSAHKWHHSSHLQITLRGPESGTESPQVFLMFRYSILPVPYPQIPFSSNIVVAISAFRIGSFFSTLYNPIVNIGSRYKIINP